VSLSKLKKRKKVEEDQKSLVEVIKNDMSIKEVTQCMTLDRIERRKRTHVADLN